MPKQKTGLQAADSFLITPSDTLPLESDPANTTIGYTFAYLHNASASGGTVSYIPASPSVTTPQVMYLAPGQTSSMMVKQVRATGTTVTPLYAWISFGNTY